MTARRSATPEAARARRGGVTRLPLCPSWRPGAALRDAPCPESMTDARSPAAAAPKYTPWPIGVAPPRARSARATTNRRVQPPR